MKTFNQKRYHHRMVLVIGLLGILLTIVNMILTGTGHVWDSFIFASGNDKFMDFMNHIKYTANPSQVYFVSVHACFPPLAYIFYHLLYRMLPPDAITNFNSSATWAYAYLLYVLYCAVLVAILCRLLQSLLREYRPGYHILLEVQILFSYSFMAGVFERGNSSFIVLDLLLAAMILRDSEKQWQKELALILIAIAAGFKIYPAVFGLLYLREKRYSETMRLVVYGVLAFFAPFFFFGGIDGLIRFIDNQLLVQQGASGVSSLVLMTKLRNLCGTFGIPENMQRVVVNISFFLVLVFVVFSFFKAQKLHLRLIFLAALMTLFPSWSGGYTIVYFLIPLLFFLRDEKFINPINLGIEFSYALIFTLIACENPIIPNLSEKITVAGCYLLLILGVISVFFDKKICATG